MKLFRRRKKKTFKESLRSFGWALLIAFLIRSFMFEPYSIPSGSMIPSLVVGDYLYISKHSYGIGGHAFWPFPKLFSGRIFSSNPERGDVMVFKLPSNTNINYIKRIVGIPGDRIQMKNGVLFINGKAVPQKRISDYEDTTPSGRVKRVPQFVETLPNGRSYTIIREALDGQQMLDNTEEYHVPEKHYFVMGDNRNNSGDSRAHVGFVPFDNILGPAKFIFFSVRSQFLDLFTTIDWWGILRFKRFFTLIQKNAD